MISLIKSHIYFPSLSLGLSLIVLFSWMALSTEIELLSAQDLAPSATEKPTLEDGEQEEGEKKAEPTEPAESKATAKEKQPEAAAVPKPAPVAEVVAPDSSKASPITALTKAKPNPETVELTFSFSYAPWKDVLEWFAAEADLSLVIEPTPTGTFNYTDTEKYSPSEAIDLINSVLLTQGYTLVRHQRMLMVINLEDGIPPSLVELVAPEDLDERGKYSIVKCLFLLQGMTPENAEIEIRPLLGPQGDMKVLATAQQVLVTETASNLLMIRDMLKQSESPSGDKVKLFVLKNVSAEEVLEVARPLLGLAEGENTSEDIQISMDPFGTQLFATGKPQMIQRLENIIELVDKSAAASASSSGGGVVEQPQIMIHSVTSADPATVLAVMSTLLAAEPDIRLTSDPLTGNLVAWARPAVHRTIKATLDEMQRDASRIEVIQLNRIDPEIAILAINKLFGGTAESAGANAPQVDADPYTGKLLIYGTELQIEQIRDLLGKMGEDEATADRSRTQQGNIRFIPLTGNSAKSAIEQAQLLWPAMRLKNRVRIVTPSAISPSMRMRNLAPRDEPRANPIERGNQNDSPPLPRQTPRQDSPEKIQNGGASAPLIEGNSLKAATYLSPNVRIQFVNFQTPESTKSQESVGQSKQAPAVEQKAIPAKQPAPATPKPQLPEAADIIISLGPRGIIIASEDIEALNQFEGLLLSLTENSEQSGDEFTIFPLQFAKAETASQLIQDILSNRSAAVSSTQSSGGSSGLLGGLLSGLSDSVDITPDSRLNTLIVQASPEDLDLIEQLLQVIDRESSPVDVQTSGKPRMIPVFNTNAQDVATIVQQIYASRLQTSPSSQQRQPQQSQQANSFQAFAGGFGRGGPGGGSPGGGGRSRGRQTSNNSQDQPMTISVDTRSNALIVSAPEPLFQEVKELVDQLDQAGTTSNETIRVISLKGTNPELVQKALIAIVGGSVKSISSSSSSGQNTAQPGFPGQAGQPNAQQAQDQIRRRIEFFNSLRSGGGFGGRGGGGGRPGGDSGGSRGRGGFGGRGQSTGSPSSGRSRRPGGGR